MTRNYNGSSCDVCGKVVAVICPLVKRQDKEVAGPNGRGLMMTKSSTEQMDTQMIDQLSAEGNDLGRDDMAWFEWGMKEE